MRTDQLVTSLVVTVIGTLVLLAVDAAPIIWAVFAVAVAVQLVCLAAAQRNRHRRA
jgi:hypothetical protein